MTEKITQAVILAGGRGTRLKPFTDINPKPMFPINGRPFLEYLVDMLKENGIKEIVMLLGYLPEKITNHFGDGSRYGVSIKYSVSDVADETGTRLKKAAHMLDEHFFMLNCDTYLPLNLDKFLDFHNQGGALATMAVYNNKDGFTKNNIFVGEDGFVKKYDRTRKEEDLNGVEAGQWILSKKALDYIPEHNVPFAEEVQPILISQNQIRAFQTDHPYYSADRPERLPRTEKFLQPKKVIFLDRDGVINESLERNPDGSPNYVKTWPDFKFISGSIKALKILHQAGYQIYIISNQPGITRGFMNEQDLADIHNNMRAELKKVGAEINGIYYCPHGWDEGCECRKPKPGMLIQAAREHHINLTKAIFIGDDERDVQAGEAAGCRTILLGAGKSLLDIIESLS